MKEKYIVRQPIKDADSRVMGYEILYYGENQAYGGSEGGTVNEFAAADTVYNFLLQNVDRSLKDSVHFMTFTTNLLLQRAPRLFQKEGLVIQIDDSVLIHPLAMRFVQQYAKEGYKIAVNEFRFSPRYMAIMGEIDYIKLNFQEAGEASLRNIIEVAHSMGKKCIATQVETEDLYDRAVALGVDGLEGSYVAQKLATKAHSSGYLQSNFFRLMVAVVQEEPDLEEIEQIISMDATLTYGLLRVANFAYFSTSRVTTIRQGIMTLGIGQLKQWIYLLSAGNAENEIDSASEEFLKLSFMRASFCSELMKHAKDMPISRSEAYLMGMFSTLDYLIDAPMEEILAPVPVAEEIKAALLRHEGRCGALYDLVISYERADWKKINQFAEMLGIATNVLTNVYFTCTEEVNGIWRQMTGSVA